MLTSSVLCLAVSSLMLTRYPAHASSLTIDFRKEYRHTRPDLTPRDLAIAPLIEFETNIAYEIEFKLGTPPQSLAAQFDTGSSDVWVVAANTSFCKIGGCANPPEGFGKYAPSHSSTSRLLSQGTFLAGYGSGAAKGDYMTDVITLGDNKLENFTFGFAKRTTSSITPIFGIGMDSLQANATLYGNIRPGLLDRLVQAGVIDRRAFSMFLNSEEAGTGSVLFGGIDDTKYMGELVTLPMAANASGVYDRYRLDLTAVTFTDDNGNTTDLSTPNMASPVILDSGVTTLILPPSMIKALVVGFGAVPESGGAYYVDCAYRKSNGNLTVQFSGLSGPKYDVPVKALIGEPAKGQTFQDGTDACKLWVQAGNELIANNLGGFSLGDPFLRNMYVVYDVDSLEISLALANLSAPAKGRPSNLPSGSGLPGVSSTASGTPTQLPLPSAQSASGNAATSGNGTASATGSPAATQITGSPGMPTLSLATTASSSAAAPSTSNVSATLVPTSSRALACIVAILGLVISGKPQW